MKYCEYKSFKTPHEVRTFINEHRLIEVLSITKEESGYMLFYKS